MYIASEGVSLTGSLDHGVSWYSREFCDQVLPVPSADTWKPKCGLLITLTQGAGVRCPSSTTVTYSRPAAEKPPRPLKYSRLGSARGASARREQESPSRRCRGPPLRGLA